jgi:membrane peptidoglycan carboxypeptidase
VCSLALGANSVTPLEMARAFATFAGRGERPTPIAVTRILDADGGVLAEREPETERVLDAGVADTVNDVLQGVISRGTARGRGIGRPAAGKTGTTQNHVDAWFVGYTPTLATAVWMGFGPVEGGAVPQMTSVRGRRVTGGSFPATIWQSFMRGALAGTREEAFEKPAAAPEPSPVPASPTPDPGLEPSPTESPPPGYSPLPLCGGVPGLTDDCKPLTPTPTLRPSPTRLRPSPSPPRSSPSPSESPEPSPLLPSPSLSPGLLPSPPVIP